MVYALSTLTLPLQKLNTFSRFDTSTWSFLVEAAQLLTNVSFLVAMRPLVKPSIEYQTLVKGMGSHVQHMKLGGLSQAAVKKVLNCLPYL